MTLTAERHSAPNDHDFFAQLEVDLILVTGFNPRQTFDEEALSELAESIKQHGLLEPLVVRPKMHNDSHAHDAKGRHFYELIAGERRLRAAKLAGLTKVKVSVVHVDDWQAQEIALVENLQRADLNPVDTALGYKKLQDLGVKQAEIGKRVGKSQPLVANTLRLLQLPQDVQERIRKGELSTAHGVALARFSQFPGVVSKVAELAVAHGYSSKQLADDDREAVPFAYQLEAAGLIRTPTSRYKFCETTCKQCPFGAYRKGTSYWGRCLKPDHYDALEKAELAERRAEVDQEIARVRGTSEASADAEVVVADKLEYGTFEDLGGRLPPAGCKLHECPSYKRGIRYGRLTTLCMDPKCYRRLSIAQTKAENKARKLSIQERAKKLAALTKPLVEIGPREAAVLAAYALSQCDTDSIAPALKGRGIPESAHKKPYSHAESRRLLDEYARLDPQTLLLAALEALVQGEAARDLDNKSLYGEANLQAGAWYVAEPKTTAIVVESEPDVEVPTL